MQENNFIRNGGKICPNGCSNGNLELISTNNDYSEYKCPSCGVIWRYYDSTEAHQEYLEARAILQNSIESFNRREGFTNENKDESLKKIDKIKSPNSSFNLFSSEDPILLWLEIYVVSLGMTEVNKSVQRLYAGLSNCKQDEQDQSVFRKYLGMYDDLIKKGTFHFVKVSSTDNKKGQIISATSNRAHTGDSISLQAKAIGNNVLVGWYANGEKISTAEVFNFVMPDFDCEITAKFKKALSTKQKKRLSFAILIIMLSIAIGGASFYAIFEFKPELLYGTSEITYYLDGPNSEYFEIETSYNKLYSIEVPTKTGYSFKGLYDAVDGGTQYVNDKGDCVEKWKGKKENKTLYAQWAINNYNIIFNPNGGEGTGLNTFSVAYGGDMRNLSSDIFRTGYNFLGWSLGTNATSPMVTDENGVLVSGKSVLNETSYILPISGLNIEIFAKWEGKSYVVTCDVNEGTPLLTPSVNVIFGEVSSLPKPTKVGHTFEGWYTTSAGGTQIADNTGTMLVGWDKDRDTTLYARWKIAKYNLLVSKNFSKAGAVSGDTQADYMSTAEVSSTTNEGYTWNGWYDSSDKLLSNETIYSFEMPGNDVHITAKWTENLYTVTYDANGGTVSAPSKQVAFGSDYSLDVPTRTGYNFDGWYTAITGGTQLTSSSGASIENWSSLAGITLYAQWTNAPYTITYNTDGGSYVSSRTCYYGDQVSLPITTRYKYDTFNGWMYNGRTYTGAFTMPAQNVTLTASWDSNGWTYISTTEQFVSIQNNKNGKFMLSNDIALGDWSRNGCLSWAANSQTAPWSFTGEFDGNGNTVSYSMTIYKTSLISWAFGLFPAIKNATICDLKASVSISTYDYNKNAKWDISNDDRAVDAFAGGIAGYADSSTITGCSTSGSINYNSDGGEGDTCVAGIVGFAKNSTISNCSNSTSLYARGCWVHIAGIIANEYNCTYGNLSNTGSISSNEDWAFTGGTYRQSSTVGRTGNNSLPN